MPHELNGLKNPQDADSHKKIVSVTYTRSSSCQIQKGGPSGDCRDFSKNAQTQNIMRNRSKSSSLLLEETTQTNESTITMKSLFQNDKGDGIESLETDYIFPDYSNVCLLKNDLGQVEYSPPKKKICQRSLTPRIGIGDVDESCSSSASKKIRTESIERSEESVPTHVYPQVIVAFKSCMSESSGSDTANDTESAASKLGSEKSSCSSKISEIKADGLSGGGGLLQTENPEEYAEIKFKFFYMNGMKDIQTSSDEGSSEGKSQSTGRHLRKNQVETSDKISLWEEIKTFIATKPKQRPNPVHIFSQKRKIEEVSVEEHFERLEIEETKSCSSRYKDTAQRIVRRILRRKIRQPVEETNGKFRPFSDVSETIDSSILTRRPTFWQRLCSCFRPGA